MFSAKVAAPREAEGDGVGAGPAAAVNILDQLPLEPGVPQGRPFSPLAANKARDIIAPGGATPSG